MTALSALAGLMLGAGLGLILASLPAAHHGTIYVAEPPAEVRELLEEAWSA